MKLYSTIIIIFLAFYFEPANCQNTSSSTFVIVHGTWGGGWAWKKVDSLLSASGNIVYRPTLTGLGERAHLSSAKISLNTHISDIVNTILYEDLYNVVLVGHSYGGMVITGVADRIPERMAELIYVDAALPEAGESVISMSGNLVLGFKIENGLIIPPWVSEGKVPPKDVPHPINTWVDNISLTNPKRLQIPGTYILTVDKGKKPENDDFYSQYERAVGKEWTVMELESDHNPQWSAPTKLSNMLKGNSKK